MVYDRLTGSWRILYGIMGSVLLIVGLIGILAEIALALNGYPLAWLGAVVAGFMAFVGGRFLLAVRRGRVRTPDIGGRPAAVFGKLSPEALKRQQRKAIALHARGQQHFVRHVGVLRFGLPSAALLAMSAYFYMGRTYPPFISRAVPAAVAWLMVSIPFGLLAGYWFGNAMWHSFDRSVRAFEIENEPPAV